MLSEDQIVRLEKELESLLEPMGKAADTILDEDVSNYPIFVLSRQEVEIGIPLFEGAAGSAGWLIHASTLEELAAKKIISMERVDDFRSVYKSHQDFLCLFILDGAEATFVFVPRK
jgi:hypothetical protein